MAEVTAVAGTEDGGLEWKKRRRRNNGFEGNGLEQAQVRALLRKVERQKKGNFDIALLLVVMAMLAVVGSKRLLAALYMC